MRNRRFAWALAGILLVAPTVAQADGFFDGRYRSDQSSKARGIVTIFTGDYTQEACATAGGCNTGLTTCAAGSGINKSLVTFQFIETVCDDLSDNAAKHCAASFTGVVHECIAPANVVQTGDTTVDPLFAYLTRGKVRFCLGASNRADGRSSRYVWERPATCAARRGFWKNFPADWESRPARRRPTGSLRSRR